MDILEVKNLKKYFPQESGVLRKKTGEIKAVNGLSFSLREGETLGLVGESGCGKTTLAKIILGLINPVAGQIIFKDKDIFSLKKEELRRLRKDMQIVFQNPYQSLNPRMKIKDIIEEPLLIHKINGKREERVNELLNAVGLNLDYKNRYPHQFSGGERQRIGIARALATNPKLIICDEPVSSLDLSVQSQILKLLTDLQKKYHLTYLFIAHNLNVVAIVSDRILVMYLGKIMELAEKKEFFDKPLHPYSEALISAATYFSGEGKKRIILKGEIPSALNPPSGCVFRTRCLYAQKRCAEEAPPLEVKIPNSSRVCACHFSLA